MATFVNFDKVTYGVSNSISAPLCNLYFCKHCLKLKSLDCVFLEVESCYCPNCMEQCAPTEAKQRKNKCLTCFSCPCCFHTLSKRAANVTGAAGAADADDTAKGASKVYYLACSFCRWTSRDAGIKDQLSATGVWPEEDNPNAQRLTSLLEYYTALAQQEVASKDRKRSKRRRELHISEKLGLGKLLAKRRSGLASMGVVSNRDDDIKIPDLEPSVASETVEDDLPDDIFTSTASPVLQVTTVNQRLASPAHQPARYTDLRPFRRSFFVKRSLRCRECQHNLCKPDARTESIKFKIQMHAINYVPEIRILAPPSLVHGKECPVALTLFNPFDTTTTVTLLPVDSEAVPSCKVLLPACELVLSAREEGSEYDSVTEQQLQHTKDDTAVVIFRKVNKIGFLIHVLPLTPGADIQASFMMKYSYINKHLALPSDTKQAEEETVWLQHPVHISLGHVAAH